MHRSARIASACAVAVVLLAASVVGAPTVAAEQSSINVPVAHIEGRGHGHGVGMSQWGAYTLAAQGASAADILSTFYPGTQLGSAGGEVVVPLERRDQVRVQFPTGGEIRSSRGGEQQPGFPVQVARGGAVDLIRDGSGYRVVGGTVAPLASSATRYQARQTDCVLIVCPPDGGGGQPPATTTPPPPNPGGGGGGGGGGSQPPPSGGGGAPPPAPAPTTTEPPRDPTSSTPVWAVPADGGTLTSVGRGRTYRGLFEFTGAPGGASLRNHVDIEHYLKGMGEVPGTWPAPAVQAQAIAARTFALRAMAASGEICDSESCQVYAGTAHESAGQIAAVDATAGTVVLYNGGFATTFYSASGGGFSATAAEGFGGSADIPYLQAKPYPTVNPKPYSLDIALTDVAGRLGYPGTIKDIRVDETGPSGRARRMTIVGDAGERGVDPQDFRRQLGLRSTLFEVTTSEAEAPPPPPAPGDDAGVVGTTLSAADLETVQAISPTRADRRLLDQSLPRLDAAGAARVSLPLVGLALLLIAGTTVVAAAQIGSHRRLHPLFALGTLVFDVSGDVTRSGLRVGARRIATMARWINPRR